jgi:hypothetical protein
MDVLGRGDKRHQPGLDRAPARGCYPRCKVAHSWIIDPDAEALAVYRWTTHRAP